MSLKRFLTVTVVLLLMAALSACIIRVKPNRGPKKAANNTLMITTE